MNTEETKIDRPEQEPKQCFCELCVPFLDFSPAPEHAPRTTVKESVRRQQLEASNTLSLVA